MQMQESRGVLGQERAQERAQERFHMPMMQGEKLFILLTHGGRGGADD